MRKPVSRSARRSFQKRVKRSLELTQKTEKGVFANKRKKTQIRKTYISVLQDIRGSKFYLTSGKMAQLAKRMLGFPYGLPEGLALQAVRTHFERYVLKNHAFKKQLTRVLFTGKDIQQFTEFLCQKLGKTETIKLCENLLKNVRELANAADHATVQGQRVIQKDYPTPGRSSNFTTHLFRNALTKPDTVLQLILLQLENSKE